MAVVPIMLTGCGFFAYTLAEVGKKKNFLIKKFIILKKIIYGKKEIINKKNKSFKIIKCKEFINLI